MEKDEINYNEAKLWYKLGLIGLDVSLFYSS